MKTRWLMMAGLLCAAGMTQAAMVTIGDAGNTADPANGGTYGDVAYTYGISDHEVTIAEMQAATGAGNGNENYWNDGARTVGTTAPASLVSLNEAMKYCNWLTSGNVNNGAYQFSGGVYQSTDRASAITTYGTVYALPTEDEWYKAAYYTGNSGDLWSLYANGTDTVPTWGTTDGWNYYNNGYVNADPNYIWTAGYGGEEQNGTYDMMGNVWEWMEDSGGVVRGGSSSASMQNMRSSARFDAWFDPWLESYGVGFRVVAIPEPATAMLVFFGAGVGVAVHRARRSAMRR
jgi:formylglycine-generating enzyme required for sulfatase activity